MADAVMQLSTSHVHTTQPSLSHDPDVSRKSLPETSFVLAVVGTANIGKSTLIRTVLQSLVTRQPTEFTASQEDSLGRRWLRFCAFLVVKFHRFGNLRNLKGTQPTSIFISS